MTPRRKLQITKNENQPPYMSDDKIPLDSSRPIPSRSKRPRSNSPNRDGSHDRNRQFRQNQDSEPAVRGRGRTKFSSGRNHSNRSSDRYDRRPHSNDFHSRSKHDLRNSIQDSYGPSRGRGSSRNYDRDRDRDRDRFRNDRNGHRNGHRNDRNRSFSQVNKGNYRNNNDGRDRFRNDRNRSFSQVNKGKPKSQRRWLPSSECLKKQSEIAANIRLRQYKNRRASQETRSAFRERKGIKSGWDVSDDQWAPLASRASAMSLGLCYIVMNQNIAETVKNDNRDAPINPSIQDIEEAHSHAPKTKISLDGEQQHPSSRLYVGSIQYDIDHKQLRNAFGVFGQVKSLTMPTDPGLRSHKGFCFVEFFYPDAATAALQLLGTQPLAGRILKIGLPRTSYLSPLPVYPGLPPPMFATLDGLKLLLSQNSNLPSHIKQKITKALTDSQASESLQPNEGITSLSGPSSNSNVASSSMGNESTLSNFSSSSPMNSAIDSSSKQTQSQPPSRILEILNVPEEFQVSDITAIFAPFGPIVNVSCPGSSNNSTHVGIILLTFEALDSSISAQSMDGLELVPGSVLKTRFYGNH